MFEQIFFTKRVLDVIGSTIKEKGAEKIRWMGYHPGFPIVYDYLLKLGISDLKVMDNGSKYQGFEIEPWDYGFRNDARMIIGPVIINDEDKDALYFLCNTHYTEFVEQLGKEGIAKEQIIDLYSLQTKWMDEKEKDVTDNFIPLSGRELQLTELNILKEFKRFCKENNLRYYIAAGTLLGAVRHKGFIPWDDDVDTYMPYEDYVKFLELYPRDGRFKPYDITTEPTYRYQFLKLCDDETYLIHKCVFGYTVMGCCIDVFPIAGYPGGQEDILAQHEKNRRLDREWGLYAPMYEFDPQRVNQSRMEIIKEKYKYSFYDTEKVGGMLHFNYYPWTVRRDTFLDSFEIPFENDAFSAPRNYDEYLSAHYQGDYMKLPPKEEQVWHPYPVFRIKES